MHRISAPTAAHVNGSYVRHHRRVAAEDRVPSTPEQYARSRSSNARPCLAKHPQNDAGGGTTVSHAERYSEGTGLVPEPLTELRSRFEWSELNIYEVPGPTGRHGVLLGTKRWHVSDAATASPP